MKPIVCSACRAGPFSYKGFRQAVSQGHYDNKTGYRYNRTWQAIAQSISKEGCHWCTIILRTRDGLPADKFPRPGEENVEIILQVSSGPSVSVWKGVKIYLNGEKAVEYFIYSSAGDPAEKEIGTKKTEFEDGPYADYEKAIQCVKECNNHEHCPTNKETYLPSRVIDCTNPSKPRLFETRRQIKGHYCALSYAWGGEQYQKTTKANIDTYVRKGINVALPQTIADAIHVTNKIGCRYLWVDALCIIQDSDEDKVKELGDMAHIYQDAYVTISALSAFRADQGFLPDERKPDILPYYVDGSTAAGHMFLEMVIPRQTPGLGKYETVVMHRPLDQRGWCLQESILSPRKLIFQPPNFYYKCRSFNMRSIARKSRWDLPSTEKLYPAPASEYLLFPVNKKGGKSTAVDSQELREGWRKILLDYTERKITVSSDKLVALAGVAEVFGSIVKDNYAAGLWHEKLLTDLLWQIWPPMGPDEGFLPRPSKYRAPTWSWASVDAKLQLQYSQPTAAEASYEAKIVSCKVTPKNNEHPYGEVSEAKLTLQAKVHPLMRNGQKCVFTKIQGTRWGDQFVNNSSETKFLPPAGNCLEPKGRGSNEERVAGIAFDCLEGTSSDRPLNYYVIILRGGLQLRSQGDWMHGILAIKAENGRDYRRVAKLDLQYDFKWLDWFDKTPLSTITLV